MIIPDVNLLIYAYNSDAPNHEMAKDWWSDLLTNEEVVGLPWSVTNGFLRLITNRKILLRPLAAVDAFDIILEWFALPFVQSLDPGTGYLSIAQDLFKKSAIGSGLIMDLHLAALSIEYSAEIHTNDADFSRFSGVRWSNPLSS